MKFSRATIFAAVLGAASTATGISAQIVGGVGGSGTCGCTVTVTVPGPGPTSAPGSGMMPPMASMPPMPSMMSTVSPMPMPPMPTPAGCMATNPAGCQPPLPPSDQKSTANTIKTALNGVTNASASFDLFIQPLDGNPITSIQLASQAPIRFGQLANMAVQATTMLTGVKGTIDAQDSLDLIVTALIDFVKVHQALLATISGKKGLIAQFGFAAPVRVALVALEGAVDSFAFALIGVIPAREDVAMQQRASLDKSLKATVDIYSN